MQLKLITPEQELLSTEADYITVPGEVGELGILPQHTYLVSLLTSGVMSYTLRGKTERYQLSGGHIEVADDVVVVMADSTTKVLSEAKYQVVAFCDHCTGSHPFPITISLNDGPTDKTSIGNYYTGRDLPENIVKLTGNQIMCPATGKQLIQKNNDQIYLVAIG